MSRSVTAGAYVGVGVAASVGESVADGEDGASVGESSRTGMEVVVSVAERAVTWR